MGTTALVVALVGLALSVASLTWQAATFFLSGYRVRVELLLGARGMGGVATGPVSSAQFLDHLASQGMTQPVLAVRAINVGRLPVTVTGCSVVSNTDVGFYEPDGITNLPHRLEPGSNETWYVTLAGARAAFNVWDSTMNTRTTRIAGRVELATGKRVESRWPSPPS
ncbi:MAG: hypothetical protein JO079_12275 [Frankiaceae bacterium]|nr:hypothetical protein [Frankiaceae bacterium]